jgi:hypothetical protein
VAAVETTIPEVKRNLVISPLLCVCNTPVTDRSFETPRSGFDEDNILNEPVLDSDESKKTNDQENNNLIASMNLSTSINSTSLSLTSLFVDSSLSSDFNKDLQTANYDSKNKSFNDKLMEDLIV